MGNIISEIGKRHQLSINTDIDGMVSGAVLGVPFKFTAESWNDSANTIWYTDKAVSGDMIFVDYYIKSPRLMCIDQHVIDAVRVDKPDPLKFNPNRTHGVTVSNYTSKYFSSTAQWIISILEKSGVRFKVDLLKPFAGDYTLLHFLCRADGTLLNYVKGSNPSFGTGFRKQNDVWIDRMCDGLPDDSVTRKVFDTVRTVADTTDPMDVERSQLEFERAMAARYPGFKKDGFKKPGTGFYNMLGDICKAFGSGLRFDRIPEEELHKTRYARMFFEFSKDCDEGKMTAKLAEIDNDRRVETYSHTSKRRLSAQVRMENVESMTKDFGRFMARGDDGKRYYVNPDGKRVPIGD